MSNPYGIAHRCVLRRISLPVLPCDCKVCDWFIHDDFLHNCFWVLADLIADTPGQQFSIEDIGEMENISVEEVEEAMKNAFRKFRLATREWRE